MNQHAACLLVSVIAFGSAACSGTVGPGDVTDAGTIPDIAIVDMGVAVDVVQPVDTACCADVTDVPRTDVPMDVPTDEPLIPDRGGIVSASVTTLPDPLGTNSTGAAAFWNFGMGTNPTSNCAQRSVGTCTIADCRAPGADAGTADAGTADAAASDSGSADAAAMMGVNAGTITIAGGATTTPMMLVPDMNNAYQPVNESAARWRMGDRLTFTATGGDVPAFTTMLDFPTNVAVLEPMPASGFPPTVPLARTGFTARWTPGTGDVVVLIGQGFPTGGSRQPGLLIQCTFPSAPGTATVPAAALVDLMPSTGFTSYGLVAIQGRSSTVVTTGAYRVTVQAIGGDFAAFAMVM